MHDDRGRVHARNHNLPLRIRSPRAVVVVVVVLLFSTLLIYYTEALELMNMTLQGGLKREKNATDSGAAPSVVGGLD